jgi:hypothetical protein
MLRHLRTHNRTIMAVGGTLLLVSWALGGVLSSMSQQAATAGATWATVGADNRKITNQERMDIQAELEIVELLGDRLLLALGATSDPAHWFLLSEEAAAAGLIGGERDGRQRAEEIAMAAAAQATADQQALDANGIIGRLMSRSGRDSRFVERTLAKVNGVQRLIFLYQSMPRFSDRRMRVVAASKLDAVACDIVALDARLLTKPEIPQPSAEELQAQLAKFGDKRPGEGENGFGYRLPDRIQAQWIEVSLASVRAAVEANAALDSLTLKKKFAENPAKFGATAVDGDPLASFAAYESTVRQKVLDELVTERMNQLTKFATDQVALSVRGLPKDGAYVRLPEDWETRKLTLQSLALLLTDEFKIVQPVLMSTAGAWTSLADARTLTGVGTASTTKFGPTAIPFTQLVERTKEFGRGVDTTPVQKGVIGPPLTGTSGSVYFFVVTEVDPSRAPATIEEAGPSLIVDVTAEDRYAALKAKRDEILAEAKTAGIRTLAESYGAKVEFAARLSETNPQMLSFGLRMQPTLGPIRDADAVREVIRFAQTLPTDRPVSELPEADRTIAFPVDSALTVAVVRITDRFPFTSEDYQGVVANPQVKDALLDETFMQGVAEALSLDALKKRHNFNEPRERDEATAEGDAAPATGDAKPAG